LGVIPGHADRRATAIQFVASLPIFWVFSRNEYKETHKIKK
jgi:hypothetical protein